MDTIDHLRRRFEALSPHLDEKSLRLFAASETLPLGRGGVTLVSTVTGIARSTIYRGLSELGEGPSEPGRVRRPGGGRQPATEVQAGLEEALVEPAVRADPERPLRWISKSLRRLSDALSDQGFAVSHTLVGRLLKQRGYTLQGNAKTRVIQSSALPGEVPVAAVVGLADERAAGPWRAAARLVARDGHDGVARGVEGEGGPPLPSAALNLISCMFA